ncbi:hypothetical protein [Azonexus sp.]|uniref:hypothetical protein n=1 Tax=Azonexus sp. TaxID=1872668 RepID=UPI0039E34DC1
MEKHPERIYHWQNSQLSIARHYGWCKFNGEDYVIAYNEEGQPLVRADLLKKPKSVKKKNEQVAAQLPLQPNAEVSGARTASAGLPG